MTKTIVRNGGKPCEEPEPSKAETLLLRGYNRLKQTFALPVATPTAEQQQRWAELLVLQSMKNKQTERKQFILNNEIYEQALIDTLEHIRVINDDFNAQFKELHPMASTPAPAVSLKSDEPTHAVIPTITAYTKNHSENIVLNETAAELLQARREAIQKHNRQAQVKAQEASDKRNEEKPKSRREKR